MTKIGDILKGDVEAENLHVESVTKEEKRVLGKIIKVSEDGWGFISSKEIKFTRIFFHWTSLKQDTLKFQELKNGMKVEFTPVEVEGKGWRAIKIRVVPNDVSDSTLKKHMVKDEPKPEKLSS
jgi:cold shock CspA family protein